jgi:hypothetical protein
MTKALHIDRRFQDAYRRADALIVEGKSRYGVWESLVGTGFTDGEAEVIVRNAFDLRLALAQRKRNLVMWGGLLLLQTALMLRNADGLQWLVVLPMMAYALVHFACAAMGRPSPFR